MSEALNEVDKMPDGVGPPKVTPLTSSTMDLLKIGFTSDKLDADAAARPGGLDGAAAHPGVRRRGASDGLWRPDPEHRGKGAARRARGAPTSASPTFWRPRRPRWASPAAATSTRRSRRILIEARGGVQSAADIASAPLPPVAGAAPARIGDVADVVEGPAQLNGDAPDHGASQAC